MTQLTHCPICYARLTSEGPLVTMLCYRCGSDLTMLFAIHQKAHHWLCLACYHFIHGKREQALECIKSALELSSSPLAHFFYFFIQQAKMDGVVLCDGRFGWIWVHLPIYEHQLKGTLRLLKSVVFREYRGSKKSLMFEQVKPAKKRIEKGER